MDRLSGKIAVVVGAGQYPGDTNGTGKACALRFAREGATVACVDRDPSRAQDTVAEILAAGGQAQAFTADISKSEDCAALVAHVAEKYGRIDILVNNVGIGGHGDGPADTLGEEAWDLILSTNLKGMWMTIKAALPLMKAERSGVILNISSVAARCGFMQTAYEISKAGVNRLTQNVARANAEHGIRCNAIMPGYIDTPMAVNARADFTGEDIAKIREARAKNVPLRHQQGTAHDVANAALFLASDEGGFISGAILPVDGGQLTRRG